MLALLGIIIMMGLLVDQKNMTLFKNLFLKNDIMGYFEKILTSRYIVNYLKSYQLIPVISSHLAEYY